MPSPYDPVKVSIFGNIIYARPIRFSGEQHNSSDKDVFGRVIKPEVVFYTCPVCGVGLEAFVDYDSFDPDIAVIGHCDACEQRIPRPIEFFIDPFQSGRIVISDLLNTAFNIDAISNLPDSSKNRFDAFGTFEFKHKKPVSLIEESDLGVGAEEDI